MSEKRAKGLPYATGLICVAATVLSVSRFLSPELGGWVLANLFADAFRVFAGRPWLLVTSPFIHLLVPHLIFNLVTMLIYGSIAERNFGARATVAVFFVGAVFASVFQMEYYSMMYGTGVTFGISGGVCAVYGFLLVAHQPMRHAASTRGWLIVLSYPALLILLFIVEQRGITPTGTVSHIAGIFIGWIMGWSTVAGRVRTPIRAATALLFVGAVGMVLWSPWLPAWRASRGDVPIYEPSSVANGASTEQSPNRALFFVNAGSSVKSVHWLDAANEEQPFTFSKRARGLPAFRTTNPDWSMSTGTFDSAPHGLSDRWIIRDGAGAVVANLNFAGSPASALLIDLGNSTHGTQYGVP